MFARPPDHKKELYLTVLDAINSEGRPGRGGRDTCSNKLPGVRQVTVKINLFITKTYDW